MIIIYQHCDLIYLRLLISVVLLMAIVLKCGVVQPLKQVVKGQNNMVVLDWCVYYRCHRYNRIIGSTNITNLWPAGNVTTLHINRKS